MITSLDCIPCCILQALEAAKMTSNDTAVHEKILGEILQWFCNIDMKTPAPLMKQRIHRRLREILGKEDPYREAKDHQNRMAISIIHDLKARIEAAKNPLDMAMRLAIAGNVIDMGVPGIISEQRVRENIEQCLLEPLVGNPEKFIEAAARAKSILYLADNAGEIVFDRLLIEQLAPARVTVAVRGGPVMNDATMPDALTAGLNEISEVIDNGSDAPGTLLSDCSPSFRQRFKEADLIIAKGQGNFETLSDEPENIFFLFKVKCKFIAEHTNIKPGSHVVTSFNAAGTAL